MKVTKESIYRDVVTGEEHDLFWFQFAYGKVSVDNREFVQLQKPFKMNERTYAAEAVELGEKQGWEMGTVTYDFNGIGWTPHVTMDHELVF